MTRGLDVSVIIPAFNARHFIRDAIQSVLAQTYAPIECIVVDDGSTDDLEREVRMFEHVLFLRQDNRGVSAARNLGAKYSSGQLLSFLDADDAWAPKKVAAQVAEFSVDDTIHLVHCGVQFCDQELNPLYIDRCAPHRARAVSRALLMQPPGMFSTTIMVSREAFEEVGGYQESLSTSADTDLACRVAFRHNIVGIDQPLVLYRQHPAQMHRNLSALKSDMTKIQDQLLQDQRPRWLNVTHRRARAALHATLAIAEVRQGLVGRGLCDLAVAGRNHPLELTRRVGALVVRRARLGPTPKAARGRTLVMFTPGHNEPGGAARRSRLLAEGMAARGWDVRVVTRSGTGRALTFRRTPNLRVVEVPGFGMGRAGALPFLCIAIPLGLVWGRRANAIMAIQPSSPGTAAAVTAFVTGRSALVALSTAGELSETSLLREEGGARLRRWLHRRSTFLAQTEPAAKELASVAEPERVRTLRNPVVTRQPEELTGSPCVLYAGRFSEEKDLQILLVAWKQVVATIEEARLVLLGSGGQYRSVEADIRNDIAADESLLRTVDLPGWVGDIAPWLDQCDVFVLPSRSEGMSNALLEACAAGRVIVVSAIPQNIAVVGTGYPFLFAPGDARALASTLESALTKADLRKSARDQALARAQLFSLENVLDDLELLIDSIARRARN